MPHSKSLSLLAGVRLLLPAVALGLMSSIAVEAAGNGDSTALLHVTIRAQAPQGAARARVAEAYVALVSLDRPLNQPTKEVIASNGVADLVVSRGTYALIVSANGFQDDVREVRLFAGTRSEASVELFPSFEITGAITDAEGHPIGGARVSQARVVSPQGLRSMSELAFNHLGSRLRTTSDANGWWKLPASIDKTVPLLVEARGYAPACVVYDPAKQKEQINVTLRKGASLRVESDRIDPDLVITVVPAGVGDRTVPSESQLRVWGRDAKSAFVEWDSLPAGEYRLVAQYADPLRFTTPVELHSVSLVPGRVAETRVQLPPAPPAATSYVRLLVPPETNLADLHAFARKNDGTVEQVRHAQEQVLSGKVIYANTSVSPTDVYLTTATELIAARPRGEGEPATGSSATFSFSRAEGKLRVTVSEGAALPVFAVARYHDCLRNEQLVLPANVGKDGTLVVPLLVPCRSLDLQFEGFGPIVRSVSARGGEQKWLGEHKLVSAATAEVRVVRQPSGTNASRAVVKVLIQSGLQSTVAVAEQIAGEDGRLVIRNLPASEELTFQARDAATQLAGATTVKIDPGEHLVIDPLEIPEPASLTIAPTFDSVFKSENPKATIFGIAVERKNDKPPADRRTVNFNQKTTEAIFSDIPPGRWQILAIVDIGGAAQPIDVDTIELKSGERQHLEPTIKPLMFHGEVIARGQSIAASLAIADSAGTSAIRRRVQTGSDGKFKIVLPRGGLYQVEVRRMIADAPALDLGPVLFDPSSPSVRIQLPDGSLSVQVTSGDQPVPGVVVTATTRVDNPDSSGVSRITRRAKSDMAGHVVFDDLREGAWAVEARDDPSGRRAEKSAAISRSARAEITLELNEGSVLKGRIIDGRGVPAAAATVECVFLGSGDFLRAVRADADIEGRFSVQLPKPAPSVLQCGVTNGDGAIGAFLARPAEKVEFSLPPLTAALTIADWGEKVIPDRFWLVANDGRLFNLSWAARKIGRLGSPLTIPRMPPGEWSVVRVDSAATFGAIGRGLARSLPSIVNVRLGPGETQEIRVQGDTADARR